MKNTGFISGVLAWVLLATAGCNVEDRPATTTRSTAQAVRGSHDLLLRFSQQGAGARVSSELSLGQVRLCRLQADILGDGAQNGLDDADPDDGGWDFTLDTSATQHSASASPSNTYGATALALIVRSDVHRPILGCALDAALGMQAAPEVDSAPDFVYWVLLGRIMENPGFADLAAARYDAKVSAAGGAAALGASIRDLRHSQGYDGLIAYDLAWYTFAALGLDTAFPDGSYAADAQTYAGLILSDLTSATPLFDVNDASEAYYTDGLSWSLLALHATHQRGGQQRTLKTLLRNMQLANGAFPYNQDFPDPDLQSTAGALVALSLAGSKRDAVARQAAIGYLLEQQTEDGGWDYAPGSESTLANAEVLFALGVARDALPAAQSSGVPAAAARTTAGASRVRATPLD